MIIDSSEDRRTHVDRRKTHKDPKLLDEIWPKEWRRCPNNLNEKRDSDEIQKNPSYKLHAD